MLRCRWTRETGRSDAADLAGVGPKIYAPVWFIPMAKVVYKSPMITNERQYRITRAQAARFQRVLDEFNEQARPDVHPGLIAAEREGLESQLADLQAELQEYESLKGTAGARAEKRASG